MKGTARKDRYFEIQSETRSSRRHSIYLGERIYATFVLGQLNVKGELVDLSNDGLGVAFEISEQENIAVGDVLTLNISAAGGASFDINCKVVSKNIRKLSGQMKLRVGFTVAKDNILPIANRRKTDRLILPLEFSCYAVAEHPIFFREKIIFRMLEVSAKGFTLETSARNRNLLQGMPLNLMVQMPFSGTHQVQGKISRISVQESNRLKVGLSVSEISDDLLSELGQWLLMCSKPLTTLNALRRAKIRPGDIKDAFSFDYVQSIEDWKTVLDLRLRANQASGKFLDVKDSSVLEDRFDGYSRHLICRCNGQVVASNRILFSNGEKERMEVSTYGIELPDFLLNEPFVESGRTVVHPSYRGRDLFLLLFPQIGRIVMESGHRYLVSTCEDHLLEIYLQAGFVKFGEFKIPDTGETNWSLIVMDVPATCKGKFGEMGFWNDVYSQMNVFSERKGLIDSSIADKAILSGKKAIFKFKQKFQKTKKPKK